MRPGGRGGPRGGARPLRPAGGMRKEDHEEEEEDDEGDERDRAVHRLARGGSPAAATPTRPPMSLGREEEKGIRRRS